MSVNRGPEPLEIPNQLEIAVREQGATVVIALAGEWDLAGVPAVRDAIELALTSRPERVVLELSRLRFIDSSGIHVTIKLADLLATQNIGLVIVPGSRAVQRVFEMTGLSERLPFTDGEPLAAEKRA